MTNNLDDSVSRLAQYVNDLTARLEAKAAWIERHPDHESEPFQIDSDIYDRQGSQRFRFRSTFDPNDPVPTTSDVLTAQRFNDLCVVALSAFITAKGEAK
jgi:hypothetical protein